MSKILVIISLFVVACSNNLKQADTVKENEDGQHDMLTSEAEMRIELNNGAKWKTDDATKKNVGQLVKLINEKGNVGIQNRDRLARLLRTRLDTLVQQCKMKGPDHDALHTWLEQVLSDIKAMMDDSNDYQTSYSLLKKDVESFLEYFE